MLDHQSRRLSRRQLRQRQGGAEHGADIRHGQGRQDLDLIVVEQSRVTGIVDGPIELGLGNKPSSQDGESELMLPSKELGGLKIIPAQLGFGILNAALNEEALGGAMSEGG